MAGRRTTGVVRTPSLELVPAMEEHCQALAVSCDAFAHVIGACVVEGWPMFPESVPKETGPTPWATYFFVHTADRVMLGSGGFKGPPTDGAVEIGYEIAPSYRRRGLGTEAAAGLVVFAFDDVRVRAVLAHTLAQPGPSPALLRTLGFERTQELDDPEDGPVWQWRLQRP